MLFIAVAAAGGGGNVELSGRKGPTKKLYYSVNLRLKI